MIKALIAISSICVATLLGGAGAEAHSRYHRHTYGGFHADRHVGYRHHRHHWHRAADGIERFAPVQAASASTSGSSAGLASWYRGRTGGLTAAHRSWPFGTRVLVTNRSNGRSVVVRIDDRGPFVRGRVIDLNRPSAAAIGVSGVSPVTIERL